MKKQLFMSLVFLVGMLLAVQTTFAQASDKTKRQMSINAKGEVLDRGTKLGYISKEDIVFNNQGKKLGFIKNGRVFDADGNSLGKAKKGGQYYNENGQFVLYVEGNDEKCKILDPKGHTIGYVHKNYKLHACATHCFFKESNLAQDMDAILDGYMNLSKALADDNGGHVKEAAKALLNEETALNETLMKKSLEALAESSDLQGQRMHFATLSKQLYTIFKEIDLKGKIIYWDYCPMALEGKGANWLSLNEKILNPYMGQMMPSCGSIKEILK
ncbi:MAG TPA: DUF3347 domain-containing protein [Mariniflexile sp.]|jgi:hypothetical protein|nr:DUF3347 domain-containing protein [Mariniflexile sp.]